MEHRKVVIMGGGITALTAARYLESQGITDYLILERFLELGGLCRSVVKDGFTFDYTGHVLWRMDPETSRFVDDLMGDNLVRVDRKAAVYTHKSFVPYPFQTHLKSLPPDVAYECLYEFLHRDRHLCGTDFASWSLSRLGSGIHKHFMVPFNEKLFGVPMREMTWDWCADVPVPSVEEILRGTIIGETFAQKGNAKFTYPKVGGMQSMVDALVRGVDPAKVMTGRTICEVDVQNKVISHFDMGGNVNKVSYDYAVSTIPFRKLLKIITPQDGGARKFAFNLRSNNVACVMIGFERPLTDLHWLYVPEKQYAFYRVGFANNLTESVAPPGCGSVTAEITLSSEMNPSVNDLIKSTLWGLRDMGLLDESNDVLTEHVEFIAPAYVTYDLARRAVPPMIETFKDLGLYCAGRYGAWHYTAVADNIAEARTTVKQIARKLNHVD